MYSEKNETCFDLLNGVVYKLYTSGEYRAATIIEKQRDREAMNTYDKALEKKNERDQVYSWIDRKHAELVRGGSKSQDKLSLIQEINLASTHAKVYFIFVANPLKLKRINKIKELYDRVSMAYLTTFSGFNVTSVLSIENIGMIRSKLSSVERSVRFIKEDKPEIFNSRMIVETKDKQTHSKEEFGNNCVGL